MWQVLLTNKKKNFTKKKLKLIKIKIVCVNASSSNKKKIIKLKQNNTVFHAMVKIILLYTRMRKKNGNKVNLVI